MEQSKNKEGKIRRKKWKKEIISFVSDLVCIALSPLPTPALVTTQVQHLLSPKQE